MTFFFLIGLCAFLILSCRWFLYVSEINSLWITSLENTLPSILWIFFSCHLWFPLLCKNFQVYLGPIFIFISIVIIVGGWSEKILIWFMSESVGPVFSSMRFIVSSLTFRTLFHFELFFFFFLFSFLRLAPAAFGSTQARGWIKATSTGLYHSQSNVWSEPFLQLHHNSGNTRSLTHWVRPGIEPTYSWILVMFVNQWAMKGTLIFELIFVYSVRE